jgi:translocation and assembly module TamA
VTIWLWPLWAAAQDVRLELSGDDNALRSRLTNASLSVALERDGAEAPQDFVAAARADYERLLTGLYQEGYFGGSISILIDGQEAAALDPLLPRASVETVVLRVDPGPKFRFGQTEVTPVTSATILPEAFRAGEVARTETIRDATRAAIDGWRAEGHALAEPSGQTISANHPDQRLDVAVRIAPGPVLNYGQIAVSGAERSRPERVRAISGLRPGRRFDPVEIARAEANLRRTGAFASATVVEGESANPDGTLPLELQIVEQPLRRLGFGAEYSTVSGLTLSGFWLHRNLLGGAERLRIEAEVAGLTGTTGGIDYGLAASFLRPATFRSDLDFYADLELEQRDDPKLFERRVLAEVGFIRRVREEAVIEAGLGYQAGESRDSLGTRTYQVLTLPLEATRDRRDDEFNATSGYFANLEIMPFLGLEGSGNGVRVFADGRAYRSFGEDDQVTVALRGQAGGVWGAAAANVPASFLFFSGGGGTVRGQPYQSLAVDLGGGNEIGGRAFLGLQAEARIGITDTIGLVGFYDTGFIGADAFDLGGGEWHSGVGLGLRYDTGIGPVRLDLATPASGGDAGERLDVYIGIGQAF